MDQSLYLGSRLELRPLNHITYLRFCWQRLQAPCQHLQKRRTALSIEAVFLTSPLFKSSHAVFVLLQLHGSRWSTLLLLPGKHVLYRLMTTGPTAFACMHHPHHV
jgi:hypothetical protein